MHRPGLASVGVPLLVAITGLAWLITQVPLDPRQSGARRRPPIVDAGRVVHAVVPGADGLALPKKLGSVRFAVMGDVGRGDLCQCRGAGKGR